MTQAYIYALPYAGHVNLNFHRGANLPDPKGLLKGIGKRLRHISLTSAGAVADPALRDLVGTARDERRLALTE